MTKLQMRRAWFQVHKWIGLCLAVLIIPLCLTGSALVWDHALDRVLSPARYATTGSALLSPDTYAVAAQAALPAGARIASLRMSGTPGDPVIVASGPSPTKVQGLAPRINVYLDPPTARVLAVANSRSGPLMVMHMIHGSMMLPGVGRSIVGWVGMAMMVSCFTGLWLWWPTVGKWARGLRWRRHRNIDTNLHHLFGFWVALPLFILSLTGAWISFPSFFGPLVGENGRPMGFGPSRAAMAKAQPLAAAATPLSKAEATATAFASGKITQVTWPTDIQAAWQFTIKPAKGRPATIAVDDTRGVASRGADPDRGQAPVARLMRRIHDGDDMGPVWQTILFVAGILPAILAITGVIMWWRARSWRAALAERMRGDRLAAAAE